MTKNRQEIERIIGGFLAEHGENYMTCALATCSDNQARCAAVDARADGLTMYFVCGGGKAPVAAIGEDFTSGGKKQIDLPLGL